MVMYNSKKLYNHQIVALIANIIFFDLPEYNFKKQAVVKIIATTKAAIGLNANILSRVNSVNSISIFYYFYV